MVERTCSRFRIFLSKSRHRTSPWRHKRSLHISTCLGKKTDMNELKLVHPKSNQKVISSKIVDIYKLSDKVRGLKLLVEDPEFSFKAGQWVDFSVPGISEVAGYSICSSPEYFRDTSLIELAVKHSNYPPTQWVHKECKVLCEVQISLGGKFHFDLQDYLASDTHENRKIGINLLLIAGGVGINPLLSIFRHVARQLLRSFPQADGSSVDFRPPKVLLLYCASSEEDLIFKENICKEVDKCSNMNCEFLVTSSSQSAEEETTEVTSRIKLTRTNQRLNTESLHKRLTSHFKDLNYLTAFICGPNSMIDDLNLSLLDVGLQKDRIKFEKWW